MEITNLSETRPQMDSEFDFYFETMIEPEIEKCNTLIREAQTETDQRFLRGIGKTALILLVILALGFFISTYIIFAIIPVALFGGIVIVSTDSAITNKAQRTVSKIIKSNIYPDALRYFYPAIEYSPQRYFSRKVRADSLLPNIAFNKKGGHVRLVFNNMCFEFCEISPDYIREQRAVHYASPGVLCIMDFNKRFSGKTIIVSKAEPNSGASKYGYELFPKAKIVELESPVFSELFYVFSTDQVEARYLLSPALMERILLYQKKIGKGISLTFSGGKLYVKIPLHSPVFDTGVSGRGEHGGIKKSIRNFLMITDIVEDLNLNNDIWT